MREQAQTHKHPAPNVDTVAYFERAEKTIADNTAFFKAQGWTPPPPVPDEGLAVALSLVLQDYALVRGETTINFVLMPDPTTLGSDQLEYAAGEQWYIYADPANIRFVCLDDPAKNMTWVGGEPCPDSHVVYSLLEWGCWFNDPANYDFYADLTNREQ